MPEFLPAEHHPIMSGLPCARLCYAKQLYWELGMVILELTILPWFPVGSSYLAELAKLETSFEAEALLMKSYAEIAEALAPITTERNVEIRTRLQRAEATARFTVMPDA